MAKALLCLQCGHLETFDPKGGTTRCKCPDEEGPVVGWWVDISTAVSQIAVLPPGSPDKAMVVLLHNGFLRADADTIPHGHREADGTAVPYGPSEQDQLWRDIHKQAVILPPRPEALSVFSRRDCVIAVQRPGVTPDTHWATEPELRARGLVRS